MVTETNALAAGGTDLVNSTLTAYTLGANVENLRLLATGAANGTGNAINNLIYAGAGNNVIDGGTGVDSVSYVYASAGVAANLAVATAQATGGSGSDTLLNVENLTGSGYSDTLTGTATGNVLDGGAGADTLTGGDGSDTYYVDNVGDVVSETNALAAGGTDFVYSTLTVNTLGANVENLRLLSTSAANATGNTLSNLIYAGAGDNVIDGGAGVDTVSYTYATAGVAANLAVTTAQATGGSGSDTLLNFENLSGSGYNDSLTGDAGINVLTGGAGVDTLIGGDGSDTYSVDNVGDVVTEINGLAAGGTDLVNASVSYTLGANVEKLTLTGTGAINGTGNALNNVIIGNAGANALNGAAGADSLTGGDGSDTYSVDDVGDVVTETNALAAGGTDLVNAGVSYTLGANVENLTLTGTATLNGTGNALNNVITGNVGINVLDGGIGADTLVGGDGSDIYAVDNVGDVVTETNALAAGGTDLVNSTLTAYTLGANVENLRLLATGAANGTGNTLNNLIYAGAGNNVIDGGAGVDTVAYSYASAGVAANLAVATAQVTGGSGSDTLLNVENLTGSSYSDSLIGNAAGNVLNGGAGADTLTGGDGSDTYSVDNVGDVVSETNALAGGGTDIVYSYLAAYTLGANVENLRLLASAAANGTGNSLNNLIYAGAGANVLDGGAGVDTVSYVYASAGVAANLTVTTAQATGGSGSDTLLNVENLSGSGYSDTLTGDAAANVLDGGAGADTLVGGDGSDTYYVDNVGDVATETNGLAAGGTDLVNASVTYTLGANVENLTLTGTGAINGTGNALNNVITGNAGANALSGGAGADTLIGGDGSDTYSVDNVGDVVSETNGLAVGGTDLVNASVSYTLGANVEKLTLTGTGAINGTGNALNNVITGNAGANALNGAAGADTLTGGDGSDTYTVDDVGDVVTETNALAAGGTDLVNAGVSYTLGANVENLTLTGTAALNGTGNALNNVITGNAGINVLDGGIGADTMVGGDGSDIYAVDNVGDVATETNALAAGGTDLVNSTLTAYTLGANVENLRLLSTGAANGTGNTLNNLIYAGAGNNVIDGGTGVDSVSYVYASAGVAANLAVATAQVTGGSGSDTLLNVENLTGSGYSDTLAGNATGNVLDGGAGADTLTGGDGSDTYYVDNVGDVVSETNALAAGGTDLVNAGVSYTLGANVENLTLAGTAAMNGTGNALNNVITGNAGINVLNGGTGVDTLIGGDGSDTYYVDNVGDVVSEASALVAGGTDIVCSALTAYTLGANVENLRLLAAGAANGTGNTLSNIIYAGAGNNVLDGGAGVDTVSYAYATAGVSANLAVTIAQATGGSGSDTLLNLENLSGSGYSDKMTGNAGANVLNGGAGADTLIGGDGSDTYYVDNVGDVVTETNALAAGGTDIVNAGVSYTLGANVENLTLTGTTAINGTGNALNNVITGNAGINVFQGGGGSDVLVGKAGNDIYQFVRGGGSDTVIENDAAVGNSDVASFGADISYEQLWFRQVANDLEISVIGGSDKMTIQGWYLGSAYHVEQIQSGDNRFLQDSQVDNLVQAMAAFAPPSAGQTSLPPDYQTALEPVLAANWQ